MTEHILFLTGKLAEKPLHAVLKSMQASDFSYEIKNIGVNVASLMTAGMISRRLESVNKADRVILPGLCRGNMEKLTSQFGVPVIRGTDDLKDLPGFFGRDCKPVDLSKQNVRIFAEIVDAAEINVREIVDRAQGYANDGADVIDIGCLPDTDFPHLEESVKALKSEGFMVSIDSMESDELLRGAQAGADYLLSLKESTLWITDEVDAIPVLIPEHHPHIDSLYRAMEQLSEQGKPFIADSILDPVHFGFTDSIFRYSEMRQKYPACDIMMGIGNLTELTEADTSGINAVLFGIISELDINNVLATQVSPHACSAIREADRARRMFYAAKQESRLPKGIDDALLTTHARKPFPYSASEIGELAGQIKDPSYRIQLSEEGIHVYNRDGMTTANDPYELFPALVTLKNDAPHAFYMGVELARAQIAFQLGKRYIQDEELKWGAAISEYPDKGKASAQAAHDLKNNEQHKSAGATLKASRKKGRKFT